MSHYQMIQVAFKRTMHFDQTQNTCRCKLCFLIQEPHNKEIGIGNGTKLSFCAEFEMSSKAVVLQILFRLHSYFPNLNRPSLTEVQDCILYLSVQGFTSFFQLLLPIHSNLTEDFETPLKKLVVPLRELERLNYEEKRRKLREFQYLKSRQQGENSAVTLSIPASLELGVDKVPVVDNGSKQHGDPWKSSAMDCF